MGDLSASSCRASKVGPLSSALRKLTQDVLLHSFCMYLLMCIEPCLFDLCSSKSVNADRVPQPCCLLFPARADQVFGDRLFRIPRKAYGGAFGEGWVESSRLGSV